MERTVTLVDKDNQPLRECPITEAHQSPGLLHRALSVYVLSPDRSQVLLQRRHEDKLFGDTWANTCCTHPFPGEDVVTAGQRRLREELGIACVLRETGAIVYQAEDPAGRGAEHEYDVLLTGTVDPATPIEADLAEVAEWKWVRVDDLLAEVNKSPATFAPWFRLGLAELKRIKLVG